MAKIGLKKNTFFRFVDKKYPCNFGKRCPFLVAKKTRFWLFVAVVKNGPNMCTVQAGLLSRDEGRGAGGRRLSFSPSQVLCRCYAGTNAQGARRFASRWFHLLISHCAFRQMVDAVASCGLRTANENRKGRGGDELQG